MRLQIIETLDSFRQLRIPNRSVRAVFRQEVWNYFKTRVDNAFVK